MTKILTISRQSHHPTENLILTQWAHTSPIPPFLALTVKPWKMKFARISRIQVILTSLRIKREASLSSLQFFVIFRRQERTSVLVPSSCKFLAIVWWKEETVMLKSPNCRWKFLGECLTDACILQRNCSPIHFPHLSPLPKRNVNYWLLQGSQATLSDFIYFFCHIPVTGSTPLKVRPVMCGYFRADYPIHSVRENEKLMNIMSQFSRI